MLTDSHCHITKEYYENIDEIISNAKDNHVYKFINNATGFDDMEEVINISKKYDNIYYTLGIHPENLTLEFNKLHDIISNNITDKKFIGIGEIGLDYHYSKKEKEEQIKLLDYQLSLAEELNLPVVIHSRDATMDTIDVLKRHNCRGVIHCFSGSLETAKIYLKMGYYIGVGGVLTFKNANIKDVIKEIPLDRILLETDSPYLAPVPFRGQRNEPKNILAIAEFLADLKGISLEEVMEITENNIKNLYNI